MDLKCSRCGHSFTVEAADLDATYKCPECAATVGACGESDDQPHTLPADQSRRDAPAKHKFLNPLELGVIIAVLIVVAAFTVWNILSVRRTPQPPVAQEKTEQQGVAEAAAQNECAKNITTIATAVLEFKKKNKVFPPDLNRLKEVSLLSPDVVAACQRGKYVYLGPQADACVEKVSDPIILCDSADVHQGGRNVARASGRVEFMQESEIKPILSQMDREYERLLTTRDAEADAKKKREHEAALLYLGASDALTYGKLDEAFNAYTRLLEEFSDTRVVSETRREIEDSIKVIEYRKKMDSARELVDAGKLDEAKVAFEQIEESVPGREVQDFTAEKELLLLLIEAADLSVSGDYKSALAIYSSVAQKTGSPFWKKVSHRQSQKIEAYLSTAQEMYRCAETAEKEGKLLKALALYNRLCAEYAISECAPKAATRRDELAKKTDCGKRFLLKTQFVSSDIIAGTAAALTYLATAQNENGSWSAALEGQDVLDSVGVTGICLLPFLGEGNTSFSGTYKQVVSNAVSFIISCQKEDGLIGDSASRLHRYSHAICTLALCELKVMTEDESLEPVCEKALKYILKIQEPRIAFRRTHDESTGDTQLTAWMLLAMLSARNAGIRFHEGLLTVCLNNFDLVTDEQGRANYTAPKDPSKPERQLPQYQSMLADTAAATLGRLLLDVPLSDTRLSTSLNFLRDNQPNRLWINFPFYFFAASANFQAGEQGYKVWLSSLKSILLSLQITEGDKKGSWDIGQFADMRCGRAGETALAILSLQVPYYHLAGINRRDAGAKKPKGIEVVLTLKDDTKIAGRLVSEDDISITVEIAKEGTSGQVTYLKGELKNIERK